MKPAGKAGDPRPPQSPAAQRSATRPRKPTTPPNIGRPTKYTPDNIAAILKALEAGNTPEDSCKAVGVGYTTMREWVAIYPDFAYAVEKAGATARQEMVNVVRTVALSGNWQAAMTYLERRDPEHWGRRDRVSMTVDLNREARRLAQETGLDEAAILAEAEALLRNG